MNGKMINFYTKMFNQIIFLRLKYLARILCLEIIANIIKIIVKSLI